MNVLVTGGAGLIGMALRRVLAGRGHVVVATDITDFGRHDPGLAMLPLDDPGAVDALVTRHGIDAIVHCAAISGPMLARGEPLRIVAANIDATALLLDVARRHRMRRFVHCSSISVYGDAGPGVVLSEDAPLRPTSIYGASKVAGEQLVQAFGREYGLSGASLRIGRVYGPYRRANCHLRAMVRHADGDAEVAIPCEPGFTYHYVHVDDVAEAMAAVLEAPALPAFEYNVGSDEALTMPAIVAEARRVFPALRVTLVAGRDDVPDVQDVFAIDRISRDLGWAPRLPIGRGLLAYRAAMQDLA